MSFLEGMDQYKWYRVSYNAAGEVKDVESVNTTTSYITDNAANGSIDKWASLPNDHAFSENITTVPGLYSTKDVIVYHEQFTNEVPSINKARTFYVSSKNNTGVRVDSEVNVVFIQNNDNRVSTEFGTGIDYLEDVIADLHEATTTPKKTYNYQIAMMIENARATTVIVRDMVDTYEEPVLPTDHTVTAAYDGFHTFTITIDDGCTPNNVEVANAIKAELTSAKWDCTDVSVKFDASNNVTEVAFTTETGTPVVLNDDTAGLDVVYRVALDVDGKDKIIEGDGSLADAQKLLTIAKKVGKSALADRGVYAKVTDRDGTERFVATYDGTIGKDDVSVEFGYTAVNDVTFGANLTSDWSLKNDLPEYVKVDDTFDIVLQFDDPAPSWGAEQYDDYTWTLAETDSYATGTAELSAAGTAEAGPIVTFHVTVVGVSSALDITLSAPNA